MEKCQCVTYFNMSMTGVTSICIGNFTSVFSRSCHSVAVEDVQCAGGVRSFDVVLVRSPDELVVFLPCHVDPLTAGVSARKPQRFTQIVADVLQFLDESYGL